MTFQEIIDNYNAIKREYNYERRNVTSAQLASFKEQFAKKFSIVFVGDYNFRFRYLIRLDEICFVRNVEETVKYVEIFGGLFDRKYDCFRIYLTNDHSFYTKSEQAKKLSIGQKIRIYGDVEVGWDKGYVLSDGGWLSISPPKPFGIEFEIL